MGAAGELTSRLHSPLPVTTRDGFSGRRKIESGFRDPGGRTTPLLAVDVGQKRLSQERSTGDANLERLEATVRRYKDSLDEKISA